MELDRLIKLDLKSWCILSGLFFLVLYVYLMLTDPPQHDVVLFFDYAMRFKDGTLFNTGVVSGYPPLSWIFIIFPGLFCNDLQTYYEIFAAVDIFCMYSIGLLLYRICERRTDFLIPMLIVYLIITTIYSYHAVRKFDIVPVFFMTYAIYLFLREHYSWSVILCVIGALIKYFPALLIPIFIFMVIYERDALKKTLKGLFICVILGTIGLIVIFATGVMDYNSVLGFITSQDTRGFHIESLVGTFSTVYCHLTGENTSYVPSTDFTVDVDNVICNALIGPWMYVIIISIMLTLSVVFVSYVRNHNVIRGSNEEYFKYLAASSFLVILVFLLMNKVFSTQFMQWIYPLMMMFLCYRPVKEFVLFSLMYVVMMVIAYIFLQNSSQEIMMFRDIILVIFLVLAARFVILREWSVYIDDED